MQLIDIDMRFDGLREAGVIVLAAALGLSAGCSKQSAPASAEAGFKGQVLRILIGRSPGGTHDLYGRAIAQYLGRHVPGHPTVVVENMPGAGGLLALKYLVHQARPNGLTIGQVGLPGTVSQFTDDAEAHADAKHFLALGSPSDDAPVCVFSRASRIDLKTWRTGHVRPRLGATGYGSPNHIDAVLMSAALQLEAQIVVGYKGTAEIRQAIASGELDGACVGLDSFLSSFEPKDDYLVALQLGGNATSELVDVPSLTALVADARGKELVNVCRLMSRIGRIYGVPADTPAELVRLLRSAFDDTMHDEEFLHFARLASLPINPIVWDVVDRSVNDLLLLPPDVRARVSAILKPPTN